MIIVIEDDLRSLFFRNTKYVWKLLEDLINIFIPPQSYFHQGTYTVVFSFLQDCS